MKNNLSTIMGARLITVTAVHEATGIARSTIVNLYYRRTQSVRLDTLRKLCDYLQVPLSDLIEYTPQSTVKQ